LHDPVQAGLACGSDTAHMSIFGYNPFWLYNGRGSFEAMGSGLSMNAGDIAFKCNFAYLNENTNIIERRRVDREFDKWGIELCDVINEL
jgi:2,3-bisphosphoglycerate-independent phosphoglycerate mutase